MTDKKLSKTALKKREVTALKIEKLANKALSPIIKTVQNMTDVLKGTINLSQEILAGFKNFAGIWLTNTDKPILEVVSEFRNKIYKECLFLTPSEKTVAYNKDKMAKLQFHEKPRERAKFKYYLKCMTAHPDDTGEGDLGVPPRALRDLFYVINQIPKLMAFTDTRGVLKGNYSSVDDMPSQLGTIKADKTAMNAQNKSTADQKKRNQTMSTKLGTALVKFLNSADTFKDMVEDCHKVVSNSKDRTNVTKIVTASSRKLDADLIKLNEFLKDALSIKSPKELTGSLALIVERSDIVEIAVTAQKIETVASTKTATSNK